MEWYRVNKGLSLLFWGNIIGMFTLIPFLGLIALVAAFVLEIVGMVKLKGQDENYEMAFWLVIIGFVVGLFAQGDGMVATVLTWINTILSCAVTYYICTGTSKCVRPYAIDVAAYCISVRTWYVICMLISLAVSIVSIIPIIGFLAIPAMVVVAVFSVIATIRYLMMLWKCMNII